MSSSASTQPLPGKSSRNGMISTGTWVAIEPAAGSVPTIVNG